MTDIVSGKNTRKHNAYPHITRISGKSNSERFQNWQHIFILRIFTAETGNFETWYLHRGLLRE
jgi:hypothetical protein